MKKQRIEIEAVMWFFGMTITEAKAYIAKASSDVILEIVKGYKNNCSRNFQED